MYNDSIRNLMLPALATLLLMLNESCNIMKQRPKDTFVLVHGGFHGAWCWDKLKPLMEKKGFRVITPDHTGQGKELYNYTDNIGALLEKQERPVMLLGHSSGGMVITELAKKYPGKIKGLIYLSAFLLPEGMSPPEIMRNDTVSLMSSSLITDESNGTISVDKKKAKQLFYADCEDAIAQWAIDRLSPEPVVPMGNKKPGQKNMVSPQPIPRFYIETLNDNALGISSQRHMQTLSSCDKIYTLSSGHSPFLSQPAKLATVLTEISDFINEK